MPALEPLTFDAFRTMLAGLLDVDVERLTPEASFITDLGVDSLRLVQVLFRLEQMGFKISLESAWKVQTVGDAYHFYQEQAGHG